jgi:hypothetical protein
VRPDDFRRAFTEDERRTFNVNAYAMCGRSCVADLGRWLRRGEFNWSLARVPELVFEDGDIGKGKLKDLLVKHNYPEPRFLPGKRPKATKAGVMSDKSTEPTCDSPGRTVVVVEQTA